MYSNSDGLKKVVDGNVLILVIIIIGLNEFWLGEFDRFYKISLMFVVVGKGNFILFYFILYFVN